jgi:subtilisin family serine protease
LVCVVAADAAFAQAPQVRPARRPIPDHYIVVLAPGNDPDAVAAQTASIYQGRVKHIYRQAVGGFAIQMNRNAADALANDPRVLYVEEDGTAEAVDVQTQTGAPWGLDRVDSRTLPLSGSYNYPLFGPAVHVHVIDTGVRASHLEFQGRASIAGDFIDDDNDGDPLDLANDDASPGVPDGADCHGHGTHVAATIGGATYGVAKNVEIHAYRGLDCTGRGPISGIIAAIDAVTADSRRPAVANMSLGADPSSALDDAVRRSVAAGITYIVAAGNNGIDANGISPARVAEAITVGATDATDTKASWSNFGSAIDVFAPGVAIDSAGISSDTAVARLSGTSMAAPHVAGVAALLLEQTGDQTPLAVRDSVVVAATVGIVRNPGTGSPNRLLFSGFLFGEAEASARINVALAANGGVATASSTYSAGYAASGAINGDRRGTNWGAGGGWNDATNAAFPDWLEVAFSGSRTIDEIDVFSVQNNYKTPADPTPTMTFSAYGLVDFTVQYWTGSSWQAVAGGIVRGNTLVWRTIIFAPVTTSRIRVLVERSADAWSRIAEIEAYSVSDLPVNTPPSVSMTSPAAGSAFIAPAAITVSASASDTDGVVAKVSFYANGAMIGADFVAPYSINWSGVAAGNYMIHAVATDDDGATTTSGSVSITVNTGQTRINLAAAANGGAATASSTYSSGYAPAGAINGDRRGAQWGAGGGWNDATSGVFPDWLEIAFSGSKTINEVDVFSVQNDYKNPISPTATMTFTAYGLVDFTVQYWTGAAWQAVQGGIVRGNSLVWRQIAFPAITTSRIRVLVERPVDGWSRIAEVEAYGTATGTGATEWFVAPGGTGTGSLTSPFGRIQDALTVAQPGDTVTVQAGTYAGAFRSVRGGVAGGTIRVRAAGARGSAIVTSPGRVLTVDHPYLTVEGLVLDGQYGADDTVRVASAASNLTLRNVEVRRSSRDLIDMGGPAGVLIENSLIHHALNAAGGRTDAHGIAAGPVRNLTVRGTDIHTFSGDGIQVDPGRSAPGWNDVIIENSRIWLVPLPAAENGFAAGVVPGENGVDTKASPSLPRARITIRNTSAWGFRNGLISNMAAFNLKENIEATVDRITVYDSNIAFRLRGPTSTTPAGAWVTLTNAVVYNAAYAFRYEDNIEILRIWNTTLGSGVVRPFLAASSGSAGLNVRNLLSITALSAEASHSSNLQVGTNAFLNAAAHNYALAAGSVAVDAGIAIAAVKTDRVGVARPQGAAYDIGAYERPGS